MRKIFTDRFATKTRDEWTSVFAGTRTLISYLTGAPKQALAAERHNGNSHQLSVTAAKLRPRRTLVRWLGRASASGRPRAALSNQSASVHVRISTAARDSPHGP